jgi:hypothetical protein
MKKGERRLMSSSISDTERGLDAAMSATAKQDQAATAVAEGNSEKNKVWDETRDGVIINHIKHKTYLLV